MSSPQTLRVCGDLKTRPKFVGLVGQLGQFFFCKLSETVVRGRTRRRVGQGDGRRNQMRYARGSRAPRVRARTPTHPRTRMPAAGAHAAWLAVALPSCSSRAQQVCDDPCAHPPAGPATSGVPILEEYGLCVNDMSILDEEDLVVLCSKLKPFPNKLLRKWVQELGAEQRAAAFCVWCVCDEI
jgi:hypothetical protein